MGGGVGWKQFLNKVNRENCIIYNAIDGSIVSIFAEITKKSPKLEGGGWGVFVSCWRQQVRWRQHMCLQKNGGSGGDDCWQSAVGGGLSHQSGGFDAVLLFLVNCPGRGQACYKKK